MVIKNMERSSRLSRRDFLKIAGFGLATVAMSPYVNKLDAETKPYLSDVLDAPTQAFLRQKAQGLIDLKPDLADATANLLRNAEASSASNICGPLSVAELCGSVIYGVRPEDFWLASPCNSSTKPTLFAEAFPTRKFDRYETDISVGEYDFSEISLQPGDYLYLFAKNRGSDHQIVITERSSDGTLYSVTNYPDKDGKYVIKKVPFWTPFNKEKSWIRELAEGTNKAQFSSGHGGFLLYRLKKHQPASFNEIEHTEKAGNFQKQAENLGRNAFGDWHVFAKNLKNGLIIGEYGARLEHHAASVFKVPLAMVFCSFLEKLAEDEADFKNMILTRGYRGRTFDQLITATLVVSEEDATAKIAEYLDANHIVRRDYVNSYGAEETNLSARRSTAEDTFHFFNKFNFIKN